MTERCFICGEDNPNVLEEHHILPRRHGGGNSDGNLVTLCANCHEAVEKIYDDEFYEKAGYSTQRLEDSVETASVTVSDAVEMVRKFVNGCDNVRMGGEVSKRALYDEFVDWCATQDGAHAVARNIFGKALIRADSNIDATQRRINGDPTYIYTGVNLADAA